MIHRYSFTVLELHLDTFGHVNNATYLTLFEQARWELITENGYGLKEIHKVKQGPVILEVTIKYLKELHLRDQITITTEMVDYEGKVGHLKQCMLKANGEVACEAVFTFALFDTVARKLMLPTEAWKKAIGMKI